MISKERYYNAIHLAYIETECIEWQLIGRDVRAFDQGMGFNKYDTIGDTERYLTDHLWRVIGCLPAVSPQIGRVIHEITEIPSKDERPCEVYRRHIERLLEIIGREYDRCKNTNQNTNKEEVKMVEKKDMFEGMVEKMMPQKLGNDDVAMTMNGQLAIKRKNGDYVTYDPVSNTIINNMQFIIKSEAISKFIYLMPMAQLGAGDIIKHNNNYCYVKEVYSGGVKVVNLTSGAHSNVVDEVNIMFGTAMYQKVVSLFGGGFGQAGNNNMQFNPMMLMLMDRDNGGSNDMLETMMMMQMMNGGAGGQNPFGAMFGAFGGKVQEDK